MIVGHKMWAGHIIAHILLLTIPDRVARNRFLEHVEHRMLIVFLCFQVKRINIRRHTKCAQVHFHPFLGTKDDRSPPICAASPSDYHPHQEGRLANKHHTHVYEHTVRQEVRNCSMKYIDHGLNRQCSPKVQE